MFFTQVGVSGATGTPRKLGWNGGGVMSKNLQYLRNGARYNQGYYRGLIGSSILNPPVWGVTSRIYSPQPSAANTDWTDGRTDGRNAMRNTAF